MENVSRTRFEADDSGFVDSVNRMKQHALQAFGEMSEESRKIGEDTPQYVASRIMAAQRASDLRYREESYRLQERRELISRDTELSDEAREKALERVSRAEQVAERDLSESKLQTELLRDVVSAIKTTARNEMLEDRKGVEKTVRAYSRGKYQPSDEYERAVIEEQSSMLAGSGDTSRAKRWVDVTKGILVASAIQQLAQLPNMLATASDEEQAISSMWGSVPFVGGALSSASSRSMELKEQRDREINELRKLDIFGSRDRESFRSLYGSGASESALGAYRNRLYGSGAERMYGVGSIDAVAGQGARYGVSGVDFLSQIGDVGRAYGYSRTSQEAVQMGVDQLAIQKNQDVTQGQLLSLARLMRGTNESLASMAFLVDANNRLVDRATGLTYEDPTNPRMRQQELYQNVISLGQSRFGRGVAFNPSESINLVNNLMREGGTLSDMGAVSAIESKMMSGGSDFENAFMFQIYSDDMAAQGKEATYLGFLRWREEGATSGKVSSITNKITERFGRSDLSTLVGKQILGTRSYQEAEALLAKKDWVSSPQAAPEDVEAYRERLKTEALVTERQKSQAEIANAFTESMWQGMAEVFVKVGDALYDKIVNIDIPFSDELAKSLKEMFSNTER